MFIFLYIARDLMIDALQANHGKLFSYPVDVCGNQRWEVSYSIHGVAIGCALP